MVINFLQSTIETFLVLPEKDDRTAQGCGKVECSISVTCKRNWSWSFCGSNWKHPPTFWSGSITKVAQCHQIFVFPLESICSTNSVKHLRGECRFDSHEIQLFTPIVDWHLSSFSLVQLVTEALVDELGKGESSPQEDPWSTVVSGSLVCHSAYLLLGIGWRPNLHHSKQQRDQSVSPPHHTKSCKNWFDPVSVHHWE